MQRSELVKLRIGDIIFNKETSEVVMTNNQFSQGYEPKDEDNIGADVYGTSTWATIKVKDYEQWEYIDNNPPDKVLLTVLRVRLIELERFVYGRLR